MVNRRTCISNRMALDVWMDADVSIQFMVGSIWRRFWKVLDHTEAHGSEFEAQVSWRASDSPVQRNRPPLRIVSPHPVTWVFTLVHQISWCSGDAWALIGWGETYMGQQIGSIMGCQDLQSAQEWLTIKGRQTLKRFAGGGLAFSTQSSEPKAGNGSIELPEETFSLMFWKQIVSETTTNFRLEHVSFQEQQRGSAGIGPPTQTKSRPFWEKDLDQNLLVPPAEFLPRLKSSSRPETTTVAQESVWRD